MKLKEAIDKSSPAPFHIQERFYIMGDTAICTAHPGSNRLRNMEEIVTTQALMIHCYNHFNELRDAAQAYMKDSNAVNLKRLKKVISITNNVEI